MSAKGKRESGPSLHQGYNKSSQGAEFSIFSCDVAITNFLGIPTTDFIVGSTIERRGVLVFGV